MKKNKFKYVGMSTHRISGGHNIQSIKKTKKSVTIFIPDKEPQFVLADLASLYDH
jgi:hypothetical protein